MQNLKVQCRRYSEVCKMLGLCLNGSWDVMVRLSLRGKLCSSSSCLLCNYLVFLGHRCFLKGLWWFPVSLPGLSSPCVFNYPLRPLSRMHHLYAFKPSLEQIKLCIIHFLFLSGWKLNFFFFSSFCSLQLCFVLQR